jgi:hypothetical protein
MVLATVTAAAPLRAQSLFDHLFAGLAVGGGQVERWSDQQPAERATTLTASLRLGVVLSPSLRVGIEANGWGLETGNLRDPAKGVTVNETLFIAQVAPWRWKRLHLKAGVGWGEYHTNHADDWGSHAFGAVSLGVGYDVRLSRAASLTLAADWARGPMGDADPRITTSTGRRFRGWDLNVGVRWH